MTGPNFAIFTREFIINTALLPSRIPTLKPMLSFFAGVIQNNLHTRIRMHPLLVAFRRIGSFETLISNPLLRQRIQKNSPIMQRMPGHACKSSMDFRNNPQFDINDSYLLLLTIIRVDIFIFHT